MYVSSKPTILNLSYIQASAPPTLRRVHGVLQRHCGVLPNMPPEFPLSGRRHAQPPVLNIGPNTRFARRLQGSFLGVQLLNNVSMQMY